MSKRSLKFGRHNIGYAVLAEYPDKREEPVVVSVHLGEKFAESHRKQMQARGPHIRFYVAQVKIEALYVQEENVVHQQPAMFV